MYLPNPVGGGEGSAVGLDVLRVRDIAADVIQFPLLASAN
jgi:hypothetical protein